MAARRLRSVVVDCARPMPLARFWAAVLGYSIRPHSDADLQRLRKRGIDDPEDDPSVVIDPPGEGPNVWFERVPEPKAVKNRVHLDVNLESADEIDRLVQVGARVLRPLGAVPREPWPVLADPEGNEFCVFPPTEPSGFGA
ncbi:MAG: VOC family protein [Chloroflexi bacterium]|nr:VOC family protein [Chloroflexota bacterium]